MFTAIHASQATLSIAIVQVAHALMLTTRESFRSRHPPPLLRGRPGDQRSTRELERVTYCSSACDKSAAPACRKALRKAQAAARGVRHLLARKTVRAKPHQGEAQQGERRALASLAGLRRDIKQVPSARSFVTLYNVRQYLNTPTYGWAQATGHGSIEGDIEVYRRETVRSHK